MDIHNDLSMAHKGKLSLHFKTRSNRSVQKTKCLEGVLFVYLTNFIYFDKEMSDYYYSFACCFDKKLECDQSPPVITIFFGAVHFKCSVLLFPSDQKLNMQ